MSYTPQPRDWWLRRIFTAYRENNGASLAEIDTALAKYENWPVAGDVRDYLINHKYDPVRFPEIT